MVGGVKRRVWGFEDGMAAGAGSDGFVVCRYGGCGLVAELALVRRHYEDRRRIAMKLSTAVLRMRPGRFEI